MKFEQLIQEIRAEKFRNVYFLEGEEPFFIDEIERMLEAKILSADEKEFNQTILYGADTEISQIISEARSYPAMAAYRVVIVREAQHVGDWDEMANYFERPNETTILIICHKYKNLDKRKKTPKILNANPRCVLFSSAKIKGYEIGAWIKSYCKSQHIQIEEPAADFLAEFTGPEPAKIANELEKLSLVVTKNTPITRDLILKNVGIHKDFNIFELIKALATKNISRAVKITDYFKENQKAHHFLSLSPQLYAYFTKLMLYKYHQAQRVSDSEIQKLLGLHYGNKDDYTQGSKNYGIPSIRRIILEISDADLRVKGVENGGMDSGEVLRDLVYKILYL